MGSTIPSWRGNEREELIERGGFGSPSIFVDGSMFFGNDRLPLVEWELSK